MSKGRRRVVLALLLLLFFAYGIKVQRKAGDFRNFHARTVSALAGGPVYVDEPYAITYPPFFILLVAPYAALPFPVAKAAWFATHALLFLLLFRVVRSLLREETAGVRRPVLLWFLAIAAISRFLLSHFENEQFDLAVALGVLGSLELIRRGRETAAAVSLGAAAAAKLTPLLFVAFLLFKRKARVGVLAALVFVSLLVLPDLLLSPARDGLLLREWNDLVIRRVAPWSGGTPWATGGKIWAPGGILNQSLSATLFRFFAGAAVRIKGASGLPETVSVSIASLSPRAVSRLVYAAEAILLLPLLLLARRGWGRTPFRVLVREAAVVTTLMLLFSPQTSKPHLVVLLLGYGILGADALGPRRDPGSLLFFALSFAAATLTVDGIVGRHLGDLFQALGAVTIGVLLLYAGLVRILLRERPGGPERAAPSG
ncbi:MAG: glycosyltransferase family 87 protein [Candidatus Eisenbacteria bacterium]